MLNLAVAKRMALPAGAAMAAALLAVVTAAPSRAGPDLKAVYEKMDADGNGVVTLAEFRAAHENADGPMMRNRGGTESAPPGSKPEHGPRPDHPKPPKEAIEAMARSAFVRQDADADAKLTFAEFQNAHDISARSRFARFDADLDGFITRAELEAAPPPPHHHPPHEGKAAHEAPKGMPKPFSAEAMMNRLDVNKDGKISLEEFGAAAPHAPPPAPKRS